MLTHTTRYLSAVSQRSKRIKTAIELKTTNGTFSAKPDITNQITAIKITATGSFLGTAMKKAEIKLSGTNYSSLQNKTVKITNEVEDISTLIFEKISLGVFYVKEVKIDFEKLETTLTLFDKMELFTNQDFNSTNITFPTTVSGLIHEIAITNGLTVDATSLVPLPNINLDISENLWLKIKKSTTRDVLDEIAKATATTIVIRDEELVFKTHVAQSAQYTLTPNNLRTFKLGVSYGEINSVVLGREPQEDNIFHRHNTANSPETTFDIKIINNQILDKLRYDAIIPVYNALVGETPYVKTYDIECKTEGHAFYEIGDYIPFNLDGKSGKGFLTEIVLDIKGGIDETLKFKNPSIAKTNYQTAGSIIKTVWNTEIETDKQKQRIAAIVEKTETIEQNTRTEFSRLEQDINRFDIQIQKAGALNLLKNSAFWSWENETPNFWTTAKKPAVQKSAEAKSFGSISARVIGIVENSISQVIPTVVGETYSFGCLVKKPVIGNLYVKLYHGGTLSHTETIPHGREEIYKKIDIERIVANSNEIKIEIVSDNSHGALVSDMMFVNNERSQNWTMAQGEIANSNVVIDEKGILVKSSLNEGDYTVISPLEFSGYSKLGTNTEKVFSLNKDTTEVKKLKAENELSMTPIKIVAIKSGATTGWAFVKNGEN